MVVVVKREVTEAIIRHSLYEHASSQVYLMLQTTAAPVVTAELYRYRIICKIIKKHSNLVISSM